MLILPARLGKPCTRLPNRIPGVIRGTDPAQSRVTKDLYAQTAEKRSSATTHIEILQAFCGYAKPIPSQPCHIPRHLLKYWL